MADRRPARWRWLAVVALTVLVAEGAARWLGGHVADQERTGHPELEQKWELARAAAQGPRPPEVLVLGNSMLDAGFVPSAFPRPAFNAAFLGAPLRVQPRWARMVAGRLDPEVVVVGIHPLDTFRADVVFGQSQAALEEVYADAVDRLTPGALDRLGRRAAEVSALVRIRSTLRRPRTLADTVAAAVDGEPRPPTVELLPAIPLHDIDWAATLAPDGANPRYREGRLAPGVRLPLGELADLVARDQLDPTLVGDVVEAVGDGPRAVVVIPPVATEVLVASGLPGEALADRAELIAALATGAGAEVVDLSDDGYPTELFSDPLHLNAAGATRFTADLARALA